MGLLLLVGTACTSDFGSASVVTQPPAEGRAEPPALVLHGEEGLRVELAPVTSCWSAPGPGICVDGALAPEELAVVDGHHELFVEFPVAGWEFEAGTTPFDLAAAGTACPPASTRLLPAVGATLFRLVPEGAAGDRVVSLFGRGPQGDVATSFRWRTTDDGVAPVPEATVSLQLTPDGRVQDGPRVRVTGLGPAPAQAGASVTVTGTHGASHTWTLAPEAAGCVAVGAISLVPPVPLSVGLGPPPLDVEVTLVLDGTRHTASVAHPGDAGPDGPLTVPLSLDPPLTSG